MERIYYVSRTNVTPEEPEAGWYVAAEVPHGPFQTRMDARDAREDLLETQPNVQPDAPASHGGTR